MKLIIAGSRDINNDDRQIESYLNELAMHITIEEVVSGGARGADKFGEMWAAEANIPVKIFPAHWDKYGYSAGPRRNLEMAKYADGCVVFWDGNSKGSINMIAHALKHQCKLWVYTILSH